MNTAANAGEVFSEEDEEMDEETKERHRAFERKREMHYSKEAAFAKRKAKELLAREEGLAPEDVDEEMEEGEETSGELRMNGTT